MSLGGSRRWLPGSPREPWAAAAGGGGGKARNLGLLAGLLAFLFPGAGRGLLAQGFPEFRWSHPLPHGNNIADLVYRAGIYHHVADHGGLYSSSNRLVWDRRDAGTARDLRGLAWMGSRLLVTGEEGTALWSDDGIRFSGATLEPATTDWLEGVAATNGLAVAVGDNGAIYRTTNGTAWSRVNAGFSEWLSGVAQGGGTFVAVGESGFIASSSNGTTWSRRSSGTTVDLQRVTHGGGRFYVVGRDGLVLTSANGTGWSLDGSPGVTNALLAAAATPEGERLVVGESAVLLRKFIGGWENQLSSLASPGPAPAWNYAAAAWDGTRYLVGGRTGVLVESYRTNAIPWTGLTFWFRTDDSPRNWLWEVAHVAGTYLAVGDLGTLLSSANGVGWQSESADVSTETTLYGVGGGGGMAFAAGTGGTLLRSLEASTNLLVTNLVVAAGRTNLLVSTNTISLTGVLWAPVASGLTTNTLQGVAWNGSGYVVVGAAGTVLSSGNGTDWTLQVLPGTGFLSGVTGFGGGWLACGTGGALFSSADGKIWTRRVSGTTNWIYRVRAAGGGAVAVGQNGTLLTSIDGVEWTARVSGTDRFLTDARGAGGDVYVCGTGGTLLRSTNLVDWTPVAVPTGKALNGLAGVGGQLVTAGAEGIILRAVVGGPEGAVAMDRFGMFQDGRPPVAGFVFRGTPEQRFRLEGAGDLGNWEPESDLDLDANGSAVLGRAASEARRLYRTRLLP